MTNEELNAILRYTYRHDTSNIEVSTASTPEFMAFANKLFQGKRGKGTELKDKKRVQIRMAILIGLAIELKMLPASNADYEGSVFCKFAPLFHLAPQSVQTNYYRHKPWIAPIVEAILQYHDDKNSVQQEAWPSLQRHMDDLEAAIHLIIPNRLK